MHEHLAFVNGEIHDTEVVRVLSGRMAALSEREKDNDFVRTLKRGTSRQSRTRMSQAVLVSVPQVHIKCS